MRDRQDGRGQPGAGPRFAPPDQPQHSGQMPPGRNGRRSPDRPPPADLDRPRPLGGQARHAGPPSGQLPPEWNGRRGQAPPPSQPPHAGPPSGQLPPEWNGRRGQGPPPSQPPHAGPPSGQLPPEWNGRRGQGPPPADRDRPRQPQHVGQGPPSQPGFDGRSIFIGPADQDPRRGVAEPPGEHSVFAEPPAAASGSYGGYEPPPSHLDDGVGKPSRSWKQRFILGLGVVVVLGCLSAALAAAWVLRTYNSIGRVENLELNTVAAGEPKNYLIVGSDTRAGDNGQYGSVGGQRSDSIMVLRVDPQSEAATVLSFPRDLQVQIPGVSGTRKINEAYAGDSPNPQRLIETLRENFGIPIHHYVEIDFNGFKNLVDHVGGIELWFDEAVRNPPGAAFKDYDVGLWIPEQGCVTVDGTQALALARSRVLEYRAPDGWVQDPTSDYGRMARQQIVIRQAMKKAVSQARSNPLELKGLLELASETVVLDEVMDIDDMLDLADRFKDFDPAKLLTYSLPTYTLDAEGKGVPHPDEGPAEPILNIFRGLPINEVGPSLISLQVRNGSGKDGQAANVAGAFQKIGFEVQTPDSSPEPVALTTVFHAPGQEAYGLRIARHVTGGAMIQVGDDLDAGEVRLVTGANFTTIHEDPTPIDKLPTPTTQAPGSTTTTAPATTTTTAAPAGGTTATTAAPPPTTIREGVYTAGQPPPGTECG